ncbi:MAG: DUF695 domain-containing protein [Cytophagaceae bacterium]
MLFKNPFKNKDKPDTYTPEQFWAWFGQKHKSFYKRMQESPEEGQAVLNEVLANAQKYYPGINGLIGLHDGTVELIFTPDGIIRDFVFILELVEKAPDTPHWKFIYLKPDSNNFEFSITWDGYEVSKSNVWFYVNEDPEYPDEIDICLIYDHYTDQENYGGILNGLLIYLDYCIGELNMATRIDFIDLKTREEMPEGVELIPLEKIRDYIIWREKEFLQKYDKASYPLITEESYSVLEAEIDDKPFIALINAAWKDWEYKPVYSWCVKLSINYKGQDNGLPSKDQLNDIQNFEEGIMKVCAELGICHIGRTTHNHESVIYLYSNEYLQVSKALKEWVEEPGNFVSLDYSISRDKYWRQVGEFYRNIE